MPATRQTTRVLLIEDSRADAGLIRAHLTRAQRPNEQIRVVHVETLADGLEHLAEGGSDVVLLDLHLPDSRGIETVVRAVEAAPHVPVIVLTGLDDEQVGARAVQAGAQDYLVKGFLDGALLTRSMRFSAERHRLRAELEAAHHQVERSEAHLRTLVEHLSDGVALLDAGGAVLASNPAAREALPHLAEQDEQGRIRTLGGRELADIVEETARGGWSELAVTEPEGRVWQTALRLVDSDGDSTPRQWLVLRDVTLERRRRRHAERQQRLAALGQVAAGLAHDLGNQLQVITGGAELLAVNGDLPAQAREHARGILEQGTHAAELSKRLMDLGRDLRLEPRPLDLAVLVEEWFRTLGRMFPPQVDVQMSNGLTDVPVRADATQLRRVLTNLSLNARDAMPGGGEVTCELSLLELCDEDEAPVPGMEPGPWAVLSLADTGVGIPPSALDQVFEPFFTTRSSQGGLGLGLAQVHAVVRAHGGYVDVASLPDVGSVFTVFLPQDRSARAHTPAPMPSEDGLPRGDGERILVVDDEVDVRELLSDMLRHLGYEPVLAPDAQLALPLFEAEGEGIAAVLADVTMPGMSGVEMAEILLQRHEGVRVALLTAHDLTTRAEEFERRGIAGWFRKPVSLARLARGLADLVQ